MALLFAVLAANAAVAAEDLSVRRLHTSIDNFNDSLVPSLISDAVSDVDMQLRLAEKNNAVECAADTSLQNQAFDTLV